MDRSLHDMWCLLYLYYTGGDYRRKARKIAKYTKMAPLKDFCTNVQEAEHVHTAFLRLEEAWLMSR